MYRMFKCLNYNYNKGNLEVNNNLKQKTMLFRVKKKKLIIYDLTFYY